MPLTETFGFPVVMTVSVIFSTETRSTCLWDFCRVHFQRNYDQYTGLRGVPYKSCFEPTGRLVGGTGGEKRDCVLCTARRCGGLR